MSGSLHIAIRKLFWHGTPAKNLRGILSKGLVPTHPDKMYREYLRSPGEASVRSIATYGGVYLTDEWFTAYSAAGRADPKGPRAFVAVDYETRTPGTLADEDDILSYVETEVGRSAQSLSTSFGFLLYDHREVWGSAGTVIDPMKLYEAEKTIKKSRLFTEAGTKILQRLAEEFPRTKRRLLLQNQRLTDLAANVARAYFRHLMETDLWQTMKRLPEKLKDYARGDAWRSAPSEKDLAHRKWQHDNWRAAIRDRPRAMKGTWHTLRMAVEALSKALPETTDPTAGRYRHNIRVMDPIGFSGKNKIVFAATVDDKGSWKNPTEITVHYNRSRQAFDQFIHHFRDRIGKDFYVVDKSGKMLLDNRKQVAASARVASRYRNARHMRRLYHGTSSENLDAIKRGGVRSDPARRLFEDDVDRPMPGHIYLTPDPGVALSYAGRSSRRFGGDPLVLVFHMKPNDPRFVADEDWLATVRGFIIESGLAWYPTASVDLGALWALAKGETTQYPSFLNVPYGSQKHVKILIDMEATFRYIKALDDVLKSFRDILAGKHSSFADITDDMDDRKLKQQADRLTGKVSVALERLLSKYAPHPWVPTERILQFLLDPFMHDLANLKGVSGYKRDVWPALQERLLKEWPEWFGPDAPLISQRPGVGSSATVALKAPNLQPDEGWIIDRPGLITSYHDLGRKGRQVL